MTVPNRSHAGGAKPTALSGPITNAAGTFTVTAGGGTGWPDGSGGNFIVCVDPNLAGEEKILCSARAVDTFTVAASGRGYDGTVASAHANLAVVTHVWGAIEADELNDHVLATAGVHGLTGTVVGTSDAQTLTNKTLTAPTISSFTNAAHDHSNTAGAGKLAQANTHQSPDTDAATTSLHHTIGAGANQAAAGNHTHASGGGALGAAAVATNETYSGGATFGDLATAGPAITVTVPASGQILVSVSYQGTTGAAATQAHMAVQVGGSAPALFDATDAVMYLQSAVGNLVTTRQAIVTGTPGASLTLTAKYAATTSAASFRDRVISAISA